MPTGYVFVGVLFLTAGCSWGTDELESVRRRAETSESENLRLRCAVADLEEENAKLRKFLYLRQDVEQSVKSARIVQSFVPNLINCYEARYGVLPPSTLRDLQRVSDWEFLAIEGNDNRENESAECLSVALRRRGFSQRLSWLVLPLDEGFGNTDRDEWNRAPVGSGSGQAYEILDAWGNPLVYIPCDRYGEPARITNYLGVSVAVHAVRGSRGFCNPDTYQIISVGSNGRQDDMVNGLGDDHMNFVIE